VHGAAATIEQAHELLSNSGAESVEVHTGDPVAVA
jgi:hypothetical protein